MKILKSDRQPVPGLKAVLRKNIPVPRPSRGLEETSMKFDPGEVIHFNPGDPLPISTDTPALLRLYLEKYELISPEDKDLIRTALAQALH